MNYNRSSKKVSVVMATYNGAEYIKEQLDSICPQLSDVDELIICDDCSSDNTVAIIKEYIAHNKLESLIALYINEKNMGFQNNFNKVMNLATGDYIFFADQDDVWMLDKVEKMINIMASYEKCELLCCDFEPWYMNSDLEAPKKILDKMPNDKTIEHIELNDKTIYIGQLGCCMCLTKDFLDSLKDYWFDGWAHDDRCWRMALCDGGLYIYHDNLLKHRIHDNNTATFGKYHTIHKRSALFEGMINASKEMKNRIGNNSYEFEIVSENIKMMELRLQLLKTRNLFLNFKLIKYWPKYQTKKSILIENYMILRGN